MSAVTACDRYKVTSQNDREQLDMAKGEVYRKGYYDGIMIVKGYEGEKVQDVKKRIQRLMINSVRWCHHSDFIDWCVIWANLAIHTAYHNVVLDNTAI